MSPGGGAGLFDLKVGVHMVECIGTYDKFKFLSARRLLGIGEELGIVLDMAEVCLLVVDCLGIIRRRFESNPPPKWGCGGWELAPRSFITIVFLYPKKGGEIEPTPP